MKSELESEMSAQTAATTQVISNTMSFDTEQSTEPAQTSAAAAESSNPPNVTDFTNITNFTENFIDTITEMSENISNTPDSGETLYVITPTGKKYHYPNCRLVKTIKQYVTKEEAEAMGYTPCKVCKPT
ncbi:MAG: hypothetical protein FWD71_07655 [Oscillospiraceae bacterium]|nr:hypothetical protein [Oscillospiraceae bacterium]